jgi:tetratricopeptide (TPR) repeat protein
LRKAQAEPTTNVITTCAGCNSPIARDATFCTVCHAPIVRRYCPKCSRLVPENTKECPYCGTSAKAKARDTVGFSNLVIVALIGIAVAYFLMGGLFSSERPQEKIAPAPNVSLSEAPKQAKLTSEQAGAARTLPVAATQPKVISDEEGTRLNLQAYELIQQKQYQQAEPVLRQAVVSFPKGTTAVGYKYALYNLGHVLRKNGRAKDGIPYLEKCVQIDPSWSKAQTELSIAKTEAGQTPPHPQISQVIVSSF